MDGDWKGRTPVFGSALARCNATTDVAGALGLSCVSCAAVTRLSPTSGVIVAGPAGEGKGEWAVFQCGHPQDSAALRLEAATGCSR